MNPKPPTPLQSLSATGIIKTNGAAAIFCPEEGVENTDGIALLGIRIKRSTLERLSGKRVTLVIYPAISAENLMQKIVDLENALEEAREENEMWRDNPPNPMGRKVL